MRIFDISLKVSGGMVLYDGDPKVEIEKVKDIEKDGFMLSAISAGVHTGTHIDAPAHFIKGGKTIDELALDRFIGKAYVKDLTDVKEKILVDDLLDLPDLSGKTLLLKTRNSDLYKSGVFQKDFIYLDDDAAEKISGLGLNAVGIDYLSIDNFASDDGRVHKTLLGSEIPIIEGLDLSMVEQGEYQFFCLPLNLVGVEAAPARCILIKD